MHRVSPLLLGGGSWLWFAVSCLTEGDRLWAGPEDFKVVKGVATLQLTGLTYTLTTSDRAFLDWRTFNIRAGETVRFNQPSSDSIVFNRINDAAPSQILGGLQANGSVILANAHGFYFGPQSMIQVGGSFVATTAPVQPDVLETSTWQFQGMPPLASIVNYGQIEVGQGRSLFLIAERVENRGDLNAPGGAIGLESGQSVLLSERADGRGLSAVVNLPSGSVDTLGRVTADGGSIALRAQVVNVGGLVQANAAVQRNGIVELVGTESVGVAADASIQAVGGGLTVRAHAMDVAAVDPGVAGSGVLTVAPGSPLLGSGAVKVRLESEGPLRVRDGAVVGPVDGLEGVAGRLDLVAGGDILFGSNARVADGGSGSLGLYAGFDFRLGLVKPGQGSIYLNGGAGRTLNGTVEAAAGGIEMVAGQDILVGSGAIRTVGGGSIHLRALAGDIDAGRRNDGYEFFNGGYRVSLAGLGGIATAAGGDVILEAGRTVSSVPTVVAGQPPGASGAYGVEPGDVTVIAGHSILGNFTLRNGVGQLRAGAGLDGNGNVVVQDGGAEVGTPTRPVNLSLVSGTWSVWSGGNVVLGEVRNPNGIFNRSRLPVPEGSYPGNIGVDGATLVAPVRSAFLFDYAPDAGVAVWAGNRVVLEGSNLPRVTGQNVNVPPIYPPRLSIEAGAGGIEVQNSVVLFPSANGGLTLETRDGGALRGRQQQATLTGITVSDSGLPDASTFAQGHAVVPLHARDTAKVEVAVSGGIENFGLTVPMAADVRVAGDTYNFGFLGQNLGLDAVSQVLVGGSVRYRGNLTQVMLTDPLPEAVFSPALNVAPEVAAKLRYDPVSGGLSYVGQMTRNELELLLSPRLWSFDAHGRPLDANGALVENPEIPQGQILVTLSPVQQAAIQRLYTESQSATLGDQGIAVSGAGRFLVSARAFDLGISGGISVLAPNAALAALNPLGASLAVRSVGRLDMTSTKIANEGYRGAVDVEVGGALDVGGQYTTFGDAAAPKGIFTASGGDVRVVAKNDVNVNGSRIAAYDGGSVVVRSEEGDVNAGAGGAGYVSVRALEPDPITGRLVAIPATIPGSGILATTLPGGVARLGDIRVDAPRGSIRASLGGIIQLGFNDQDTSSSLIQLRAARDIDGGGSGIIGSNIRLDAGGNINAVVVGSRNVDIRSLQSVNVTAFGGAGVNVSAAGGVSGTVVAGGGVSVSGDAINASLVAKNVATSGEASSSSVGVPQSNVARSDQRVAEDGAQAAAKASDSPSLMTDDSDVRKRRPLLTRRTGRVTVILPKSTP